MTPEDSVAAAVVAAINSAGLTFEASGIVAQRSHFPISSREEITDELLVLVYPVDIVSQLATRGGRKSRDIQIAIQAAATVERVADSIERQDEMAAVGQALDDAVQGTLANYTWHQSARAPLNEDWLRAGVWSTEILASYRRASTQ